MSETQKCQGQVYASFCNVDDTKQAVVSWILLFIREKSSSVGCDFIMKPLTLCFLFGFQTLGFLCEILRSYQLSCSLSWCLLLLGFMNTQKFTAAERYITEQMTNTSKLLDLLLSSEKYDRQIRPGFGGPPTEIFTDIEIRSFGSISETDMVFSMDCYFRQTWFDDRLKFPNGTLQVLSMDWKFLQKVWTPDTYFLNGKGSYLHKVTVPNKFLRVRFDGQLKYSMRLTILTNCPMHLRKYPLDKQACPLQIGSFAYTARDVVYRWNGAEPVAVSKDVTLSQYDFLNITLANKTLQHHRGKGQHSSLLARFILSRRRGYFILQIYAPCALIVSASWVSFWINKSDAPGRVAVGATTVLTLVTMGFGGRSTLPRVAYATAIDWFVIMCFTFVFAAMVEYACVNVVDRNDLLKLRKKLQAEKTEQETAQIRENNDVHSSTQQESLSFPQDAMTIMLDSQDNNKLPSIRTRNSRKFRNLRRKSRKNWKIKNCEITEDTVGDRGNKIDSYSRMLFPFAFASFNVLYWTFYLYTMDDEIPLDSP